MFRDNATDADERGFLHEVANSRNAGWRLGRHQAGMMRGGPDADEAGARRGCHLCCTDNVHTVIVKVLQLSLFPPLSYGLARLSESEPALFCLAIMCCACCRRLACALACAASSCSSSGLGTTES